MKKLWLLEQDQIQNDEIQTGDNLSCSVCGRTVTVKEAGKGPLICCGKPMDRMNVINEDDY